MSGNRFRFVVVILAAGLVLGPGCKKESQQASKASVDLKFEPSPPRVGEATARITLTGPDGKPLSGASVRLEGNMNHAGMTPSFATLKETQPGTYEGALNFTMGGDWFVLVNAALADGTKIERKIDVPGVASP